jgi:alpha-beta hydrolase superfamily lysophospholipase
MTIISRIYSLKTARILLYAVAIPLALVYAWLLVMLYFGQDRMILRPPNEEHFSFITPPTLQEHDWTPGGRYEGIVMEPKTGTPKGTVVFYHGNADTADDRQWVGSSIARNGYRVVLVEYPGFGRRTGRVTIDNVVDASQGAFQDVCNEFKGPLILAGESLGAGMAAQVAGKQGDAAVGAMLFVPWDSLLKVVQETLPIVPSRFMLHRELSSIEALSHFSKPVLIAAAEHDFVIPNHHAAALAKAVSSSSFVMLKGVGHGNWNERLDDARWAGFLAFAAGDVKSVQ